jgi:hypothetical protein
VDYQAAHDAFFSPGTPEFGVPRVVATASQARRLRDAAEPLAMHAVWSRRVNEALAEHGLDFLTSYVGGRAASLGEPVPDVVTAAFAWFSPELVRGLYDGAREQLGRDELLEIRTRATVDGLQEILGGQDVADVAETAATLRRALDSLDGFGRPLFTGLRALPEPKEPVGRLWRACDMVREYRGDGHIAAVASTGLSPVEMNIATELWLGAPILAYTATRGWSEQQMGQAMASLTARGWLDSEQLTELGRAGRDEIEARTDAAEHPLVAALGHDIDAVSYRLDGWGQLCIDADAFPPDPFKRWAG